MRIIDADELLQLYGDYGFDFSGYHVAVPVIRQNILDMPEIKATPSAQSCGTYAGFS